MKHIPLLFLLCVAQTGFAANPFNGFYAKGGLGGTQPLFDVSDDVVFNIGNTIIFNLPMDRDFSVTAFSGMLGFGYSYQANSLWVMSAEFAASFTQAEITYQNSVDVTVGGNTIIIASNNSAKLTNDFALLLKPGLITQGKTQFYVLVGPRWGNFETTTSASANYADLTTGSGQASKSEYVIGFTAGIGVERLLPQNFSVGLEYCYTSYGSIPTPSLAFSTNPVFGVTPTVTNDQDIQTSVNTVMVDIMYRFK